MKRRSPATSRRKASSSTARRGQPSAKPSRPSPEPPPPPRSAAVKVVFVAVPGRARLHVEGIRGRPAYAARLEARMVGAHGIHQARASSSSGYGLLLFVTSKLERRSLNAWVSY